MQCPSLIRSTILLLLTTACASARPELVPARSATTEMNVYRAEAVHVSILVPAKEVYDFLIDVTNWKTWAPWVRAVNTHSGLDWTLDTDTGPMQLRFVEPNALGVLDHTVTLASGVKIYNAMRVVANGSGSELTMIVYQTPPATTVQFEQDVQAVRDDFTRIKNVVERTRR